MRTPPEGAGSSLPVLPDGCSDVIFDLGRRPRDEAGRPHRWRSYVVGTMRSARTFEMPGGADLIGVRMRPGSARALLDGDPVDLVDRTTALADFWGGAADRLEDALLSMPTRARLAALTRALERGFRPRRADPLVRAAFDRIERSRGREPVGALAEAVGRSSRTLERRFGAATGIGPKEACRVTRFRHAVEVLERRPAIGGGALAARCGYADQSHLIREFRALGGFTPARA